MKLHFESDDAPEGPENSGSKESLPFEQLRLVEGFGECGGIYAGRTGWYFIVDRARDQYILAQTMDIARMVCRALGFEKVQ